MAAIGMLVIRSIIRPHEIRHQILTMIVLMSNISLKSSSLILVYSWQNPKVTELVKKTREERFIHKQIEVRSVLLRLAGMVYQAEVDVEIDGNKALADVESLSVEIEIKIRSEIQTIESFGYTSFPYSNQAWSKKMERDLRY